MKHNTLRVILLMVCTIMNTLVVCAESVTVNIDKEWTLAEKVLEQVNNLSDVTELTITGTINADDWDCITVQMTGLKVLNLGDAYATFTSISTLNSGLTTLVMPHGIKKILRNNGLSLANITFNEDLEEIGEDAFRGTKLTEVTFPCSITSIGRIAFADCDSLTFVDMRAIDGAKLNLGIGVFREN